MGGGGGGGGKKNIVKFVWGSISNLLNLGGGVLILSHHRKFAQPPLQVNNDRSLNCQIIGNVLLC